MYFYTVLLLMNEEGWEYLFSCYYSSLFVCDTDFFPAEPDFSLTRQFPVIDIKLDKPAEPTVPEGGCSC